MNETQTASIPSVSPVDGNADKKFIEQRLLMQYNIARVLAESSSIARAAGQVLRMICETAAWEFGALWRVNSNSHLLRNEGVWHADYADLSKYAEALQYSVLSDSKISLPACVINSNQPLWLSTLKDIDSDDAREAVKAGLNSAFILPVRSSGRLIAIMECLTHRIQSEDLNLMEMLNAIGNQIGIFLERKILEETLATQARQQHLLAQAGVALSSSVDYDKRLMTIMHVVVPDMADWCAIDMIDQNHVLRRVAAAHVDPAKEPAVYGLQPERTIDVNKENRPQIETLLTGQSLLYTDISPDMLEKVVTNPETLDIVRKLDPRSSIVVPLLGNDRILGICTFVLSDSRRHYSSSDLSLAEDIGRQIALGLDNAMLYAEYKRANADLERRVDERTAQLRIAINQLTNQIVERQSAEDKIRVLNSELEQRIAERTSQLEIANLELHKEVLDRQKASQDLRKLLKRTQELYQISQKIGTVRIPNEVLSMLLSSSYLKDASRASIAILDSPWLPDGTPPDHCFILAEWNRGATRPKFINQRLTLEEYGINLPVPFGKPIVIPDIHATKKMAPSIRKRFADLGTKSLIILPLIASGEWFGLLSLHFSTPRMPVMEDLRHVRGLVDETAIAIKNIRLLEAESQARHEAEAANELKLKFLAMISHELRTPLASIKGFATTLLAEDVVWSPEKQRDFLETINTESDKLSDLIEQLLDLSRIEAGTLRISPKKISVNTVIANAINQLRPTVTEHELILEESPELPFIYGDEQRISQVISNLVGNSVKYSPAQPKSPFPCARRVTKFR